MSKPSLENTPRTTAVRRPDAKDVAPARPPARGGAFFSFRHSYTELSSHAGRTHVTSRRTTLEDGKLSTETFEGECAGPVFDEAVRQAQQQVLAQAAWLMRSLSWWLAPPRGPRSDRE